MKNMLFLSFILFLGCTKIPPYVPHDYTCDFGGCDTSKIQVVWQKPFRIDTSGCGSEKAIFYKNGVLFKDNCGDGTGQKFNFFDGKTGNLIWTWKEYFSAANSNVGVDAVKFANYIFFTNEKETYSVNLETGKTNWSGITLNSRDFLSAQNNYVYNIRIENLPTFLENSHLLRTKVDKLSWDTVYTEKPIDRFVPRIENPSVWINSEGDEIAIFQTRYYDFTHGVGRIDVVAYNITQKKEYFRFTDIDPNKLGSVNFPYIVGNKAFIPLGFTALCIDLPNKKILWAKNFGDGESLLRFQPFIMANNKLYIKPDGFTMYAVNPDTGVELWKDTDSGAGGKGEMIYYNGVIYFTCSGNGKLYAIEEATGKKLWAEPSPNKFKAIYNNFRRFDSANIGESGIAIDTVNNLLYTSDYYFMMCLKLPKH